MTILLGTDFSTSAMDAARVASRIAARLGEPLRIVHVVEDLGAEIALARGSDDELYRPERERMRGLEAQAQALGAQVEGEVVAGAAPHVLADRACDATLLVIGYVGWHKPARWLLGSSAERLARTAPSPLLIVRSPDPILAWLAEPRRPLRVVLGADRSEVSRSTARSFGVLTRLGAVDVVVVHVAEQDRGGADARALERDLDPELATAGVPRERMTFDVRVSADVASELVGTAESMEAPLLAVGAHQRPAIERLWRRSVSRRVVHLAPMNVLVVPSAAGRRAERPPPVLQEVLVATDLSELGDRAVPHAMALLPEGGVLHLAYVRPLRPVTTPVIALHPTAPADRQVPVQDIVATLEALVPRDAARRGISARTHVLEGDVAEAICAAAERLAVDVVCMASRARRPMSAVVLGSATLGVLARSRRPVFVVREPDD